MVYRWRDGSHVSINSQAAGECLERLRKINRGTLTPAVVVTHARPKDSPLHDAFEWDNTVAARKYREEQARHVIASIITVIQPKHGGAEISTRAFVSLGVGDEGDRAYMSIAQVLAKPALRLQMVAQALRELQTWQNRYRQYKELSDLMNAIDIQRPIFEPEQAETVA